MKEFTVVAILGVILLLFIAILASTIIGAIVGAIVGFVFPQVIDTINHVIGLDASGWVIGATLGFVGSFFRTSSMSTSNK